MEFAIETRNLGKTYGGGIRALQEVSLKVRAGSCFGLLGPNGAGKSTLVKTLLSIVHASSGSATLLGIDHRVPAARRAVGYLPEGHRFPSYLTGRGVCHYFGQLAGLSGSTLKQQTEAKLELVAMAEWGDTRISKYSKGMLQRLGLAQAMLGDPAILFLDEPTDGVDPVGRFELRKLIRRITAGGTTIFLNSHLLSEVEEICDEIAILHRGSVMQQGSVAAITAAASGQGDRCTVTFTTAPLPDQLLGRLPAGAAILPDQRGFQATLASESAISALIDLLRAERVEIYGIQQAKLDLEEAFLELVRAPQ